ncbi:MAG: hypothetical protein NTW04_04785, partial [Elusimicrobia bacterium]|nr:hypothetical protein [Elusimicrobiota bacterium]
AQFYNRYIYFMDAFKHKDYSSYSVLLKELVDNEIWEELYMLASYNGGAYLSHECIKDFDRETREKLEAIVREAQARQKEIEKIYEGYIPKQTSH